VFETCRTDGASCPVHRLPEADEIIALGPNGEIREQGSFEQLRNAGGYVQSLDVVAKMRKQEEADDSSSGTESTGEKAVAPVAEEPDDMGKTTDRAVWKYYLSSLGWWRIIILLLLLVIDQTFEILSCESCSLRSR
jgi:ATP-binding cassette, subfamily C (CFTR/MRP), member 1